MTAQYAFIALLCLCGRMHAQATAEQSAATDALLEGIERRLADTDTDTDTEQLNRDLTALANLGAKAGVAVPALCDLLKSSRKPTNLNRVLATLSELSPYRSDKAAIEWEDLNDWYRTARVRADGLSDSGEQPFDHERLRTRFQFPLHSTVEELIEQTRSRNAYRIETAIDLLATKGPAATAAIPALLAQLNHPEPRLLPTDRTVPIYRKVANAIAAIAPGSHAAKFAEQVASGKVAAPIKNKPIPARAKARVDALAAELANSRTRADAIANLLALGELSALPVAALLTADREESHLAAAIDVLIQLGPRAHKAVPAIVDALTELPAPHTVGLIEALAHSAPWCRDVVPFPHAGATFQRLTIRGKDIKGDITGKFLDQVASATQLLQTTRSIDPTSSLDVLSKHLASTTVSKRECALAILRERGESARSLLPKLATMLTAEHPKMFVTEWIDARSIQVKPLDRSANVHKAAAKTILAIARPDDPERKLAQAFLKQN